MGVRYCLLLLLVHFGTRRRPRVPLMRATLLLGPQKAELTKRTAPLTSVDSTTTCPRRTPVAPWKCQDLLQICIAGANSLPQLTCVESATSGVHELKDVNSPLVIMIPHGSAASTCTKPHRKGGSTVCYAQ